MNAVMNAFSKSEQNWLQDAIQRLKSTVNPDLVMVFGSRARGTATRKSDLDLMLVYQTSQPPLDRIGEILQLLSDCPWPLEVVAYTPEELENIQDRPFIKKIQQEGKVIYEHRAA